MEYHTATQTISDRLRAETATAHTQLEELPISKSIISPSVSKEEYTRYLTLMHDVVKDTEVNIAPLLGDIVTDLDNRSKVLSIEADLEYLDAGKTAFSKPLSEGMLLTPGFALGIYYVVEGSSLGGRVILKNIKPALNLDENGGAKYFSGYGPATGSTWRNFMMMMEEYAGQNDNADEIIAGANFAFTAIKKHLEENTLA